MISPQVGCILMAAGASSRFGSDKLAVDLDGRSLLRRACEAVPREKLSKVCIVTARAEGISLAAEFGFQHVLNDRPEAGASRTVQLGLEAIQPCDAALFMTADQPLLLDRVPPNRRLAGAARAHSRLGSRRSAWEPLPLSCAIFSRAAGPGGRVRRLSSYQEAPRCASSGRGRGK